MARKCYSKYLGARSTSGKDLRLAQIWTITSPKITSHKTQKDKSLTPPFGYFRPLDLGKMVSHSKMT